MKISPFSLIRSRGVLAAGLLSACLGAHPVTGTGILTVTTLTDSGAGSLREAVASATSGETINFDATLSGETIALTGTQLLVAKNLIIDASALGDGVTVSGSNASRVFDITSGNVVVFDSVSVTGGSVTDQDGAGIRNNGTLTVRNATISGNVANNFGKGGGISNSKSLTIENSTISGNDGREGGGIWNSGSGTSATLRNVTMFGNTSLAGGGAIGNHFNASLTLIHTTISGNTTSPNPGGGISMSTGVVAIENTIIAGNTGGSGRPDISKSGGTITPTGTNLIGNNTSVETEFPAGPLAGTGASPLDALLGSLGDFGGVTRTMPPLPGSPAIEGAVLLAGTPATDQRGSARPSGPLPDIGAVEAFPFSSLALLDTDFDGIDDRIEPAYPQFTVGVNDSALDSDGDGSTDATELANMTDPLDGADYFGILNVGTAPGFDPVTNPLLRVTIKTFPGLDYSFETNPLLDGPFTPVDGSLFTADGFTATFDIPLETGRDFVRARRE